MYALNASNILSEYYIQNKKLARRAGCSSGILRSTGDRLLLADPSGKLVGDTAGTWLNRNVKDVGLFGRYTRPGIG